MTEEEFDSHAAVVTGLVFFLGSWVYCVVTYGYLFGVGLGRLPSLMVGVISAALSRVIWWLIGVAVLILILQLVR